MSKKLRKNVFLESLDDESNDEVSTHLLGDHLTMHRPPHHDRFGMVRFRVEFNVERQLLRVTIIGETEKLTGVAEL